jgi:pyrroline-5-carboxylate reductase
VTSKGGTTYAALQAMEQSNVQESIVKAIEQARIRAVELGDMLGQG